MFFPSPSSGRSTAVSGLPRTRVTKPEDNFAGRKIGQPKAGPSRMSDEGLALYFPAPHSYTGEDVLELHGHGGPVVLDMLLARVLSLGVRQARPGEFTERAFLNGKLDL